MCLSQHTLLFNCVKSTQIRTLLLYLGTTTIPAHQSVSTSTLRMTPSASTCFSSDST